MNSAGSTQHRVYCRTCITVTDNRVACKTYWQVNQVVKDDEKDRRSAGRILSRRICAFPHYSRITTDKRSTSLCSRSRKTQAGRKTNSAYLTESSFMM